MGRIAADWAPRIISSARTYVLFGIMVAMIATVNKEYFDSAYLTVTQEKRRIILWSKGIINLIWNGLMKAGNPVKMLSITLGVIGSFVAAIVGTYCYQQWDQSRRLIIHVDDYHMVDMESFKQDLLDQDESLTDEDIDERYHKLFYEVMAFQWEQYKTLKKLLKEHNLNKLFQERLVIGQTDDFDKTIELIKEYDLNGPDSRVFTLAILNVGNAGKMLVEGSIQEVVPVEDQELFLSADPMKHGYYEFDVRANEAREDFIIDQMLKSEDHVMVLICGRGHDFGNNIPNGVKFKRIEIPLGGRVIP